MDNKHWTLLGVLGAAALALVVVYLRETAAAARPAPDRGASQEQRQPVTDALLVELQEAPPREAVAAEPRGRPSDPPSTDVSHRASESLVARFLDEGGSPLSQLWVSFQSPLDPHGERVTHTDELGLAIVDDPVPADYEVSVQGGCPVDPTSLGARRGPPQTFVVQARSIRALWKGVEDIAGVAFSASSIAGGRGAAFVSQPDADGWYRFYTCDPGPVMVSATTYSGDSSLFIVPADSQSAEVRLPNDSWTSSPGNLSIEVLASDGIDRLNLRLRDGADRFTLKQAALDSTPFEVSFSGLPYGEYVVDVASLPGDVPILPSRTRIDLKTQDSRVTVRALKGGWVELNVARSLECDASFWHEPLGGDPVPLHVVQRGTEHTQSRLTLSGKGHVVLLDGQYGIAPGECDVFATCTVTGEELRRETLRIEAGVASWLEW